MLPVAAQSKIRILTYTATGTFSARAQARDIQGATSGWSSPQSINITEGIVITGPNGGETYLADEDHPIHWNWYGDFPTVKIECSADGGSSRTTIVSSTENDGCYHWRVPYTSSTFSGCRVRVSHPTNLNIYDISDASFTIARDTISVVMPNGGENYHVGEYYPVFWDWTGDFYNARIDYSTDGGATWNQIAAGTGNYGYYRWTVPNVSSSNCRIRIANAQNINAYGLSPVFEIRGGAGRH